MKDCFSLLKKFIKKYPNDYDLGSSLRKLYFERESNTKEKNKAT